MIFKELILFITLLHHSSVYGYRFLTNDDLKSSKHILNLTADIIKDTHRRTALLNAIQKRNSNTPAFEIGYLTYNIQEKYRRMVDKYNTSVSMMTQLYLMELILYLEDIEHHFWEITHLTNMIHEIERKYDLHTDLHVEYDEDALTTKSRFGNSMSDQYVDFTPKKKKRTKQFKLDRYFNIINVTSFITNDIIGELSWATKLKLMNYPQSRRVGISMLTSGAEPADKDKPNEDTSMKMKLFRLMYENVRDSDLKVKRAELIKTYYANYSTFEMGFILGEVTDKHNIMTDISQTVKRMYNDWRPVEHINAYEQIANKAIEIAHLVDMVKVINKRRFK